MPTIHDAADDTTVTFSDLSRHTREVASRVHQVGRLRVTHRDSDCDLYLSTAWREEAREANLSTASRFFSVMIRHEVGVIAIREALGEVFPWTHNLTESEQASFAKELVEALSDAADLEIDGNAREVVAGWRATARIKADKGGYSAALEPTSGDFGPVEVVL